MKGDIIAKIRCENNQQKLRVGDIHNKDNVTLVCDQPTKTWSIVSMSDKVNKNVNLVLDLHRKSVSSFPLGMFASYLFSHIDYQLQT